MNATAPLLSIIIPTLNEAEHLPELMDDLQKKIDIIFEVIVADGGSSDTTEKISAEYGARFVRAEKGRGMQMNAAAAAASGEFFLFLHADSRIDDPAILSSAVRTLKAESAENERIAGHFRLQFMRTTAHNERAYRYVEEKSAFNRANTTNGDQGLLLSRGFFSALGGFDESLPFLEDQRIAGKIRAQGKLVTLPGYLKTAARRFETEGFHRRYILMSMMMGLYAVGAYEFFVQAPHVYRTQQETGTLLLTPFFSVIRQMMRSDWGWRGTVRLFYLLGRYIRQNSWQMFFFLDVLFRRWLGAGRYPFLNIHDRWVAPCTNFRIVDLITGTVCFIWFMGILAPYFWCVERINAAVHRYFYLSASQQESIK